MMKRTVAGNVSPLQARVNFLSFYVIDILDNALIVTSDAFANKPLSVVHLRCYTVPILTLK